MKRFDCLRREPTGRHELPSLATETRVHAHWDPDGNYLGWSDDDGMHERRFVTCVEHEHRAPDIEGCWCGTWWYADEHDGVPEHEHEALPDPITWTAPLPY